MTERLKRLQEANPHIHIYDVHSDEFKQYGTLISKETKEICHLTKSCLEIPAETPKGLWNLKLVPGGVLYANFYKCGDDTPQPHFISWSPIDLPKPDFHAPQFFGVLELL